MRIRTYRVDARAFESGQSARDSSADCARSHKMQAFDWRTKHLLQHVAQQTSLLKRQRHAHACAHEKPPDAIHLHICICICEHANDDGDDDAEQAAPWMSSRPPRWRRPRVSSASPAARGSASANACMHVRPVHLIHATFACARVHLDYHHRHLGNSAEVRDAQGRRMTVEVRDAQGRRMTVEVRDAQGRRMNNGA
jgi:hypothetical protein